MAKIDISGISKTTKKKVKEAIAKVQESEVFSKENILLKMKEMVRKGGEAVAKFQKESKKTDLVAKEVLTNSEVKNVKISKECALKVYYLLISIDKEIGDAEIAKFDEIGFESDPDYFSKKEDIINYCSNIIDTNRDDEEHYDIILDTVGDLIKYSINKEDGDIHPKLFIWNLFVIGNIDGPIKKNENRLIRYIARILEINKDILFEMETSLNTLLEIEKEEYYLKTSDKKYSEVEPHINELSDRKQTIMQGIHALILD